MHDTAVQPRTRNYSTAAFLIPWIAVFSVFWLFPILYSLVLSFTQYSTLQNTYVWRGLGNYAVLMHDPGFQQAFINTLIFSTGTIPPIVILSLVSAVALDSVTVFRGFYRSVLFIPSVTSLVVVSLVFTNLYARGGYLSSLLHLLGMSAPARGFLLEPATALPAVMAMDIWFSIGYYALIFLAALPTLPRDVYESATLDGAGAFTKFFHITVPALRPAIMFVIVVLTIKSLQVFVEIYVMTKGGPLSRTTTIVYEIYRNAFERMDGMGYASAMAYALFIVILLLSIVYLRLLRER